MSEDQPLLIDIPPAWSEHWKGMPGYEHRDLKPQQTVLVHFRNEQDRLAFAALVKQRITSETKYLWYPEITIGRFSDKLYDVQSRTNPCYPVYVISKGRWESRLTVKALEKLQVPYHVVIEPQEFAQYAAVIDPIKILIQREIGSGSTASTSAQNDTGFSMTISGAFTGFIIT